MLPISVALSALPLFQNLGGRIRQAITRLISSSRTQNRAFASLMCPSGYRWSFTAQIDRVSLASISHRSRISLSTSQSKYRDGTPLFASAGLVESSRSYLSQARRSSFFSPINSFRRYSKVTFGRGLVKILSLIVDKSRVVSREGTALARRRWLLPISRHSLSSSASTSLRPRGRGLWFSGS